MRRSLLVGVIVMAGCGGGGDDGAPFEDIDASPTSPDGASPAPDGGDVGPDAAPPFHWVRCDHPGPLPRLVEDRTVYDEDPLDVLRVDVAIADLDQFAEVNAGVEDAEVPVVFTEGDYSATGMLRIRGGASRENVQKNYKVEIDDAFDRWHGQREINLNKHMWDLTRVRNKLAFDIFQTIPDFTSLRTRFVNLFVNGQDYGMYTWIEEPDKKFLQHHGLDPLGQLYKPVVFTFKPLDGAALSDPEALEAIIDPKANEDNAKLQRMLLAIADPNQDIDAIVDRYFQRDNLLTWIAINILLNDVDTVSQNFYLYSPSSCEGWYFLPWDYDGAWNIYGQLNPEESDRLRYMSGLTNWWSSKLWKRFVQKPANVAAIRAKMAELEATVLNDDVTADHLADYHALVQPFISRSPDMDHLPGHYGTSVPLAVTLWQGEQLRITGTVSRFEDEYDAVVERPMPIHIAQNLVSEPMKFSWARSVDLQNDPLTYDLQIATSPEFTPETMLIDVQDTTEDEWRIPQGTFAPGTYYWRVVIEDHKGPDTWQLPYVQYQPFVIP